MSVDGKTSFSDDLYLLIYDQNILGELIKAIPIKACSKPSGF